MLDNRNQIILGNQARDNLIMFKLNNEVGASLSVTRDASSGDYLLNLISKDGMVINSIVLPTSGVISADNKISSDFVNDTDATNLFVTSGEKSTWSGKQDALTAGVGIDITSNTIKTTGVEYVSDSTTQLQPLKFVYMDETSYANMDSHDSNTLYLLYATTP